LQAGIGLPDRAIPGADALIKLRPGSLHSRDSSISERNRSRGPSPGGPQTYWISVAAGGSPGRASPTKGN
jgi:hypothetical protein